MPSIGFTLPHWAFWAVLIVFPIVAWFMVRGVQTARRRQLVAHRRASLHVLAQLSVAVSSRLMLVGFDALGFDHERAYLAALWVPVLGSAAFVEWLCRTPSVERERHEAPDLRGAVVAAGLSRAGR